MLIAIIYFVLFFSSKHVEPMVSQMEMQRLLSGTTGNFHRLGEREGQRGREGGGEGEGGREGGGERERERGERGGERGGTRGEGGSYNGINQ